MVGADYVRSFPVSSGFLCHPWDAGNHHGALAAAGMRRGRDRGRRTCGTPLSSPSPAAASPGPSCPVLADAVASGAVRAGDLAFVRRAEGGALTPVELAELDPEARFGRRGGERGGRGAERRERGGAGAECAGRRYTVALVVREDLWTSQLARTFREAGGAFVAHERFGATGLDADAEEAAEGDDIITRLGSLFAETFAGAGTCSRTPSSRSRRPMDSSSGRWAGGSLGRWSPMRSHQGKRQFIVQTARTRCLGCHRCQSAATWGASPWAVTAGCGKVSCSARDS
ncbi:hypothetical protein SCYAM73S_07800 [Streptomyces cyaneofuscatus]